MLLNRQAYWGRNWTSSSRANLSVASMSKPGASPHSSMDPMDPIDAADGFWDGTWAAVDPEEMAARSSSSSS